MPQVEQNKCFATPVLKVYVLRAFSEPSWSLKRELGTIKWRKPFLWPCWRRQKLLMLLLLKYPKDKCVQLSSNGWWMYTWSSCSPQPQWPLVHALQIALCHNDNPLCERLIHSFLPFLRFSLSRRPGQQPPSKAKDLIMVLIAQNKVLHVVQVLQFWDCSPLEPFLREENLNN